MKYQFIRLDGDYNRTGVYKITIGPLFYIGSASGNNTFYKRSGQHESKFNRGEHQSLMQLAAEEYGVITFEIIQYCEPDKMYCRIMEQNWLNTLGMSLNIRRAVSIKKWNLYWNEMAKKKSLAD